MREISFDDIQELAPKSRVQLALQFVLRARELLPLKGKLHMTKTNEEQRDSLLTIEAAIDSVRSALADESKGSTRALKRAMSDTATVWKELPGRNATAFVASAVSHLAFAANQLQTGVGDFELSTTVHASVKNTRAALALHMAAPEPERVLWAAYDRVRQSDKPAPADTNPGFNLYIDPGAASLDDLRSLFSALNALHIASGGSGFVFTIDGERLRAHANVHA